MRAALLHLAALVALANALVWLPATPARAQAANLLVNAGFENGLSSWSTCGTAEVVDAQSPGVTAAMVYAGRRALRLYYDLDDICGGIITDPYGAAEQSFAIPADAADVTVSFWYSRVGNPIRPAKVSLAEPGGFGYLTELDVENLSGWHLFRYELTLQQLERVRGKVVVLTLALEYGTGGDVPQADNPGFYLDDVRVAAAIERTAEAPRPADLKSDGLRPLVYLDAQLGGIARMNIDGTGAQLIYEGVTTPLSPAWSQRGDRVAVAETWLTPEDNLDSKVNPAQISIIKVFNAGGGGARELLRTTGLPGYEPIFPTPSDPRKPALDVRASYVTWAPNDQAIALSICAQNRYKDGDTSDPICWIELFDATTGASKGKFEPGFEPRWSTTNRILYNNDDAYKAKPQGIYEVDLGANPPNEQLLVPGTGKQFSPSFYTDRSPTWSPDGARFATVRKVDGFHYNEAGTFTVHYAIMLFDRNELIGRQILLADRGSAPDRLAWSPDGNFILYTIYQRESADIWWLDTRTGATGRLTTNGASAGADWRQRCPTPDCRDAVMFNAYLPLIRR
ncbi:MAG: PD40 domain-containing protein [Chloroflexales bacterium]|nr:PD40 domain-containing protein [Chloroflexales bacterium]